MKSMTGFGTGEAQLGPGKVVLDARSVNHRYLDVQAGSMEDAIRLAVEARDARRPLSIGLLGNAGEVVPNLLALADRGAAGPWRGSLVSA